MSIVNEDHTERVVGGRDPIDWNEVLRAVATIPNANFKNPGERYVMCFLRWHVGLSLSQVGQILGLLDECVDLETRELDGAVRDAQNRLSKSTNRTVRAITRKKRGRD